MGRGDAGPLLQGHGARQHGAGPGPGQVPPGAQVEFICPNFSDNKGLQNSPVILSNGGSARGAALLRAVWRGRDAGSGTAHPRSTRPRGGQPCTS